MYSLTQAGNLGQLVSMILVLTGMGKEEAEAGSAALLTTVGVIAYLVSFVTGWIGRYRQGDLNLSGTRK